VVNNGLDTIINQIKYEFCFVRQNIFG